MGIPQKPPTGRGFSRVRDIVPVPILPQSRGVTWPRIGEPTQRLLSIQRLLGVAEARQLLELPPADDTSISGRIEP